MSPLLLAKSDTNRHAMNDPFTQEFSCLHSRRPIVVRSMMALVLTECIEVPLDTVREAFRAHHLLPSNLALVKTVKHTGWVLGIAAISDCEIAACARNELKVVVINMDTGMSTVLVERLIKNPRDVTCVGRGVVAVTGNSIVFVIELATGTILKTISGFAQDALRGMVMLDENTLAVIDKIHHGILLLPLFTAETCAAGSLIGQDHLHDPCALCMLDSGCTDFSNATVSLIDCEGALLRVVKHMSFGSLSGICNIGGGMLAIADVGNKLHIVSLDTNETNEIIVKSIATPNSCVRVCLMGCYLIASIPGEKVIYVLQ